MKLNLKKLIILTSFLTIALCSISQVKYIINSDTIIGYTYDENREIATIFVEGEQSKDLLDNCDSVVDVLLNKEAMLTSQITTQANTIDALTNHYNKMTALAKEANKANKKAKRQLVISKVLITALTIIIVGGL